MMLTPPGKLALHVLGAEHKQVLPGELSKMLMLNLHVLGAEHKQVPPGELSMILTPPGKLALHVLGAGHEQLPPGELSKMLTLTLHVLGAEHEPMPPGELSKMLTLTSHVLGAGHEGELSKTLTLTSHVLGAGHEQMPPGELSKMLTPPGKLALHVLGAEHKQVPPGELSKMLTLALHVLDAEREQMPPGELSKLLPDGPTGKPSRRPEANLPAPGKAAPSPHPDRAGWQLGWGHRLHPQPAGQAGPGRPIGTRRRLGGGDRGRQRGLLQSGGRSMPTTPIRGVPQPGLSCPSRSRPGQGGVVDPILAPRYRGTKQPVAFRSRTKRLPGRPERKT
jgi:peptidyl-tRNA hydrolase